VVASPKPNRYIDAYPRTWKTLPVYDLTYLRLLAETIGRLGRHLMLGDLAPSKSESRT
jgi:hypothetical protein